ncbi:MAG TPA: C4-dicarboxylate ABC transporter [Gammaproteobacteria bacterium]|nr:C4-dicarboxylate ABC transporter [Gammaproteobacteria bacterium]
MNTFKLFKKTAWALIVTCLVCASQSHAKTLKLATISPEFLEWMQQLRTSTKQIEQVTDGRVKFRIYPGGAMGDDDTVLRKMRIGQLHGGVVAAGSLTRFFPDLQIYNLPLTFKSYDEVDYIRQRMDQRIVDGLRTGGIVSFHLTETGFAYLLSKDPVKSVEDVRKLKAWIPDGDPIAAELIKTFGVSPIPLSIPDVLPGLQTGIIDAVAVPPVVALSLQWHNHVDYMLDLPLIYVYSMLAMDSKSLRGINDEDLGLVRGLLDKVFKEVDADNRQDNKDAFQALVSQGIKVTKPGEDDLPAWEAIAKKSIEDLVGSGEISADIVSSLENHLSRHRKEGRADEVGAE